MQRVAAASGARYSTHNEKPRRFEPIAPVGTNYTPIGKPDIAAMRRVPPAPSSAVPASSGPSAFASTAKPSIPTAPRPVFGAPVPAPVKTAPPSNAPDDDWGDESPAPHPPPPAVSRPPVLPNAPRPAPTSVSIRSGCCVSCPHIIHLQVICTSRTYRPVGSCAACIVERPHQACRGGSYRASREFYEKIGD